jgi:hypothetical protein
MMKRTLFTIGFAVLLSMMFAPRKEGGSPAPFFMDSWPYYSFEYTHMVRGEHEATKLEADRLPLCERGWSEYPSGCLNALPPWKTWGAKVNPYADIVTSIKVYYPETEVVPAQWVWRNVGRVAIDKLILQTVFLSVLFVMLGSVRIGRKKS